MFFTTKFGSLLSNKYLTWSAPGYGVDDLDAPFGGETAVRPSYHSIPSNSYYRFVSYIQSSYCWFFRYSSDTREASFSVGLQRVDSKDLDKIKAIIDKTWDQVIE